MEAEPEKMDGPVQIDQTKALEFLYSHDPGTRALGLCGSIQFEGCYGRYPIGIINGKEVPVTEERLIEVAVGIMLGMARQIAQRVESEWLSKEEALAVLDAFISGRRGIDTLFRALGNGLKEEGINPRNSVDVMELCSRATLSGVKSRHLADVSRDVLSYLYLNIGATELEMYADSLLNLCYTVVCAGRESRQALETTDFLLSIALEDQTKLKALNIIDSALDKGMDVSCAEETLRGITKGKRDFVLNYAREVLAKAERLGFNRPGARRKSGPATRADAGSRASAQGIKGKQAIVRN